ncbi:MAG: histidine kinase [Dysgonomonas sp.]|nr:histidine kinase [Dysgonomonas sp.]
MEKVSDALEKGESDESVAESYEKLAKEFSAKGEYDKAEDYLSRAKKLYEKLKNKDKIAYIDNELAKVQEAQGKIAGAIVSLNAAQKNFTGGVQRKVAANNVQRLSNQSNPQAQGYYIQQNIELLKETNETEEQALAFRQMAQVKQDLNQNEEARENLSQALATVKDNPNEVFKIKKEIANTYIADNQLDKAIAINKDLVAEAQKTKNTKAEIEQLQTLSNTFFDAQKASEGITTIKAAYDLAVNEGQTLAAKNSLEMLVEQYKKDKKPQKALDAYADFMDRLESLMKGDSTLIDAKFFEVQEKRITQLEKERTLKDALIAKQNTFNYVLLGSIILISIFLIFIAKALYSIKKKNKRIALQSLRREMNPHFIFNSLNSVNQFIAQNNELEANKYLSSYSKLMRNIMENSNKDFIPLTVEIEQLKEYLDLEYMRFHDKFTFHINIDESLDTDAIFIPNMLIQPQLENAIWHGLRYKEDMGLLTLTIKPNNTHLYVIIEDDGIGLTKSHELKTKHQKQHKSRGLTNTQERINLLNSLYNIDISIDIREITEDSKTGVIVTLRFPMMNKNK